jgi:hypothetical protein
MGILFIGGVLFGTILGRFFKVFILVPICGLAVVLALAKPNLVDQSLVRSLVQIIGLVASIQFGYVLGAVSSNLAIAVKGFRKTYAPPSQSSASRSLHVR